jgi:hypothetical protein
MSDAAVALGTFVTSLSRVASGKALSLHSTTIIRYCDYDSVEECERVKDDHPNLQIIEIPKKNLPRTWKAIDEVTKNGEFVKHFPSVSAAAKSVRKDRKDFRREMAKNAPIDGRFFCKCMGECAACRNEDC